MQKKTRRIQKILSQYFLINMIIIIFIFMAVSSVVEYRSMNESLNNEMMQNCQTIADDIDSQIKQMDTICLNIIHSVNVKQNFSNLVNNSSATAFELNTYKNNLANSMTSIKGVDSSIRLVNIYDLEGTGFGTGNHTGPISFDTSSSDTLEHAYLANGYRYFPHGTTNVLFSRGSGTYDNRYYFSLIRMYFDDFHNPIGYVEVVKYLDVVFQRAEQLAEQYGFTFYVYSEDNQNIYPSSDTSASKEQLVYEDELSENHTYEYTATYSDFNILVAIPDSVLFAPMYKQLLSILLLFLLSVIACFLIAIVLSKRISAPLKAIYHKLTEKEFNTNMEEIDLPNSYVIEVEKLKDSLNESMRLRKDSMQSIVVSKEQEMQAMMLALQSQMNPHFLYNSLSTISALVSEGKGDSVEEMCLDITSILRYISSNQDQTSSLEEELEHCTLYLNILRLRHGESLSYDFNIDDAMLDIHVPKLCIQLLVENAVKFSTHISPPWHIRILGWVDDFNWYVDVQDNGPGFDNETSKLLRSQMDEILATGLLPSLEINGMGILNIFIRLYLLYGISFIFDFGNLLKGGAFVRIGGPLNGKDKN
ncbi:MAG: histidine kinase [Suipraeoptans sp.]